MTSAKQRVLSGMRPTGRLHLGHYFGAITNWIRLQNQRDTECLFFSADWHALTTAYTETQHVAEHRREMFADWIGAGIDPSKATLFAQSAVPEHAELNVLLGMITPLAWLERVPSYKEIRHELAHRDLSTIGFLNYPLLQTADIIVHRATHVPVGEDQLAHLELSREVVRRFNSYYKPIFPEPAAMLTETKRVAGLDSRKMSKSYNNSIYLSDTAEQMKEKIMPAPTDPARVKRSDPGTPEVCNIYAYHKLVQTQEVVDEIATGCRTAGIGCVDCKKRLITGLTTFLAPMAQRRQASLESGELDDIVAEGNRKARASAQATMAQAREAIGL
jgi:tryptophanyl-tRNA synthetase